MKPFGMRSKMIGARSPNLTMRLSAALLGAGLLLGLAACKNSSEALNDDKTLTAFSFEAQTAVGVIDESSGSVAVTVPFGTSLKNLVATFATSGDKVLVGGVAQVSATTSNDFSYPVAYRVCAEDGSSTSYLVTVSLASNTSKRITSFVFPGSVSTSLSETNKTIAVKMPYGSSLAALVASFTTTGKAVNVGGTVQVSASSVNDFSSPVVYTVVAADGSSVDYTITVTLALNPAKAISSFSFSIAGESVSIDQDAGTIAVSLPYWNGAATTDISALKASFETTGASVKIGTTVQVSGSTVNSFASAKVYKVMAADGTSRSYTVTVTRSPAPKALTAFSIAAYPDATALIDESAKTVFIVLPVGSDVSALVPSFTLSQGASATVGGVAQTSGTTANDFGAVLHYLVLPADGGASADYAVTVVAKPAVPAIAISPAGTYVRSITLSCASAGAEIYYTTDGSAPSSGSLHYTTAITAAGCEIAMQIRAVATKLGASSDTVSQALRVGKDFAALTGAVSSWVSTNVSYPWDLTSDGTYLYETIDDNGQPGDVHSYINKIDISNGTVTALAGSKTERGNKDSFGSAALFNQPAGIVCDGQGKLYVSDCQNHTIRKVVISSGEVSTIAGNGIQATLDGVGTEASFQYPSGLAYDGKYLYVVDCGGCKIRRIDLATMKVTTVAGGGYSRIDGIGLKAGFISPQYIAIDGANLYVSEDQGFVFRKISLDTFQVTTLAGSSQGFADGPGSTAKFDWPGGMVSDGSYLYVADGSNQRIRKIDIATGAVSTLAGDGSSTYFSYPDALATDGNRLFEVDRDAIRIIQ